MPQDQCLTFPPFASLRHCAFALNSSKIGVRLLGLDVFKKLKSVKVTRSNASKTSGGSNTGSNTLSNAFPCKNPNLAWVLKVGVPLVLSLKANEVVIKATSGREQILMFPRPNLSQIHWIIESRDASISSAMVKFLLYKDFSTSQAASRCNCCSIHSLR